MLAKSERIEQLALAIARRSQLRAPTLPPMPRAARLCKADLVTNAVVEFTSQQGVMGGYYATAMGENDEVAHAIAITIVPALPATSCPRAPLAALWPVPTSSIPLPVFLPSASPRPALPTRTRCVAPLSASSTSCAIVCRFDPTSLIDFALELYSEQDIEFDAAEVAQQVPDFFHGRLVSMARDEKIPADTVAAVSAVHIIAPSSSSPAAPRSTKLARTMPRLSTTWLPPMPAPRTSPSPSWVRSTIAA